MIALFGAFASSLANTSNDTIKRNISLDEVEVISTVKESTAMRQLPSAVSIISKATLEENHIYSLKEAAPLVPNLFMPDYGSRLTSALYIRGIGSRINSPAIGLYVDNVPYYDKSAFDFHLYDIERVDVLRGPQGTLYGRNAMGGIMRIYTRNPFSHTGTEFHRGFATRNNHLTLSLTHYHHVSNTFAFSGGGYYESTTGFFRNSLTGEKVDHMKAGGGRWRGIYKPSDKLNLDMSINYDYTDEGAYPYFWEGRICNNREGNYRRGMLNVGVNMEYKMRNVVMNSITGYQNLNDRMFMDQDFTDMDIYTLEQKQRINTISEELTFKSLKQGRWEWISGANIVYQGLKTVAPVTFYSEGIHSLIENNVNSIFTHLKEQNDHMPDMKITVQDDSFIALGNARTPTWSTALFHQSKYNTGRWTFTAGLRLEYEKMKMDYNCSSNMLFDFTVKVSQAMSFPYKDLKASPQLTGVLNNDYIHILPKGTIMYHLTKDNNLYISVSKGSRSGGYNVQMMSDVLPTEMKNQMILAINGTSNMMKNFVDINSLLSDTQMEGVRYKPEYSWNYEVGTHLNLLERRLQMDAAVFLIKTYDQQIARFSPNGLGRMMVNAGRSRSYGIELSMLYQPDSHWIFKTNYGNTHATFRDYDGGVNKTTATTIDYRGKVVPFVPRHTVNIDASYTWNMPQRYYVRSLSIGGDYRGTGDIYWTEANDARQGFYSLFGARISIALKRNTLRLWTSNIFNKEYNVFYTESAGRKFEQHCKPFQFGIDFDLSIK